jgi:hypothetical protein
MVQVRRKHFLAHRLIWMLVHGPIPPGMEIDHIDHDHTNNRIDNLRLVTRKENMRNQARYPTNKTGVNGVRLLPHGRYQARIHIDGHEKSLGNFKTLEEAAAARAAADRLYGFHPNHGKEVRAAA